MKKILLLVLFLISITSRAQKEQIEIGRFMEYLNAHEQKGTMCGVVLVAKQGDVIFRKAYGYANAEWKTEHTVDSKFRLASVSKQFTAMLILQLVQETKIKLAGKISDYLPYYRKDNGSKISIRQLLTHCSGIPSYTDADSFFVNTARLHFDTETFVKKHCSGDLEFEPGTKQTYNNSAYFILGAIIEKVTGMTYAQAVKERIFDKLGMENSGYDYSEKILTKRAMGYTKNDKGELENSAFVDMSTPFSAGALYSTVDDMHKWDRSLYTDQLLVKQWRDSMFSKKFGEFGYGWIVSELFGKKVHMHSGGINGFSTNILRFPADEVCVIVLMNLDFGNATKISRDLAAILFNEKYELPRDRKPVQLEEKVMKPYVGQYQLGPDFIITVTLENGGLVIQATGQPKIPVLAEGPADFFVQDAEISITFESNKKGKVTGLVLHQNGDHKAPRIK